MPRPYEELLNRLIQRLRAAEIDLQDGWLSYFFINIRGLLERETRLRDFPITSFYIDWIVHNRLDRNTIGQNLVNQIAHALENPLTAVDRVSELIGIHLLRRELTTISRQFQIDNLLAENVVQWRLVAGQTLRLVLLKPIILNTANTILRPQQIENLNYRGYPVFWLTGDPGQPTQFNVSIVPADRQFEPAIVQEADIFTYVGGLFHVE